MLGSTLDLGHGFVELLVFSTMLGSTLVFQCYPRCVLFPGRQAQLVILADMDQKEQLLWHVLDWFHWWCCTSRCFRVPGSKARDDDS